MSSSWTLGRKWSAMSNDCQMSTVVVLYTIVTRDMKIVHVKDKCKTSHHFLKWIPASETWLHTQKVLMECDTQLILKKKIIAVFYCLQHKLVTGNLHQKCITLVNRKKMSSSAKQIQEKKLLGQKVLLCSSDFRFSFVSINKTLDITSRFCFVF